MAGDEGWRDGYSRDVRFGRWCRKFLGHCSVRRDALSAVVAPKVVNSAFDMVNQISAPALGRCGSLDILPKHVVAHDMVHQH